MKFCDNFRRFEFLRRIDCFDIYLADILVVIYLTRVSLVHSQFLFLIMEPQAALKLFVLLWALPFALGLRLSSTILKRRTTYLGSSAPGELPWFPGTVASRAVSLSELGDRPKSYDLIVWDCDGVLVDSEALLKQGEVEALEKLGFKVTVDDCTRMFSGVSPDQAELNFKNEMGASLPSDFFKKQISGSMDLFRARLRPLMTETVLALHARKIPMCVASGSPRDRVLLCLELAGIRQCFPDNCVFTREMVSKGKPAPDLFLKAAELMGGVSPERCIVIEDASSGIEAARAAKMPVLAYLGGGHAQPSWYSDKIKSYGAPLCYTSQDVLSKLNSL